jgi:hypothetical protein
MSIDMKSCVYIYILDILYFSVYCHLNRYCRLSKLNCLEHSTDPLPLFILNTLVFKNKLQQ